MSRNGPQSPKNLMSFRHNESIVSIEEERENYPLKKQLMHKVLNKNKQRAKE
jgi:hypothetical protein